MSSFIDHCRRSSMDFPPRMASRHDATQMNPGSPALYQLNMERKYIDGNQKKLRRWTYGQKDKNKKNKVALMVGETGAGKTTIINTMINYLLGVKFQDQEFYQITEETEHIDETITQTSAVTVYEVFVEEKPTSLTIIDTPGYGNTEGYDKDREISEYLSRLFSGEDGIHYIDAVCFVMKASQNRLSDKQLYIFHSVLSLFGRDIENNIVFLLTHSDGGPPTDALNAIKKAEIPCRRDEKKQPVHFLFNNRQKEKRDDKCVLKSAWEMGNESMNRFFKLLEEKNRKSVQMTLDVLKQRRQLEACVSNLKEQINEKEVKTEELTEIQEAIRQNRDKIEKCENFKFTVNKTVKENVSTEDEWWWNRNATCCFVCQENCHVNCWWDIHPSTCEVMKNSHCTVCTGKCHYSKHVRGNKKYVIETKTVSMTFGDLKQEYERTGEKPKTNFDKKIYKNITKEHESNMKESENNTEIEEQLINDLEKIKNEKSKLLQEAFIIIVSLSEIALKPDSAFTLQHLDFLIPRLKEEGEDEWMKNLEDRRKAGEKQKNKGALRHVMDFTGKKNNQFDNRETVAMASFTHHHRRKSMDEPPEIIAGVIRLKDEFIELYERDQPQLQECTERLRHILKTFEKGYRCATEGSRDAGLGGIIGGAGLVAGLAFAPFTLGAFFVAAVIVLAFATWILIGNHFLSVSCSSDKKYQMTQLGKNIEAVLKEFQDKINPMAEKMKDIHELTENLLRDQDAIRIAEDTAELIKQMSETMILIAKKAEIHGGFSLVFNMVSAENTRMVKDMNRLVKTPIDKELDESEMKTNAGKFIVKMRKLINQIQNVVELEKTKDKLAVY